MKSDFYNQHVMQIVRIATLLIFAESMVMFIEKFIGISFNVFFLLAFQG